MHDPTFGHHPRHQSSRFFHVNDGVVGAEASHTDRVIDGHKRFDASTERAVVLLTQVVRGQVGALFDQVLNEFDLSKVCGHHQRCDPVVARPIHVRTQFHQ